MEYCELKLPNWEMTFTGHGAQQAQEEAWNLIKALPDIIQRKHSQVSVAIKVQEEV